MSETEIEQEAPAEVEAEQLEGEGVTELGDPDAEDEETIEGPQTPGDEPADEAPAQPSSEAMVDERYEKLGKSATTWRNRISAVLGEDAQYLVPCELCEPEIPGFHWPAEIMQPANELQARMIEVLKAPEQVEYKAAPHAHRCEDCDGLGLVASGSRKPGNETVACPTCKSAGYVTDPRFQTNGATGSDVASVLAPVGGGEQVVEDADAWGSPRLMPDGQENPNYGRMPQYKNLALP